MGIPYCVVYIKCKIIPGTGKGCAALAIRNIEDLQNENTTCNFLSLVFMGFSLATHPFQK
jgi:hypothetical protein